MWDAVHCPTFTQSDFPFSNITLWCLFVKKLLIQFAVFLSIQYANIFPSSLSWGTESKAYWKYKIIWVNTIIVVQPFCSVHHYTGQLGHSWSIWNILTLLISKKTIFQHVCNHVVSYEGFHNFTAYCYEANWYVLFRSWFASFYVKQLHVHLSIPEELVLPV